MCVCHWCVASVPPSMHPAPDTDRERERRASVNFLLEFIIFLKKHDSDRTGGMRGRDQESMHRCV